MANTIVIHVRDMRADDPNDVYIGRGVHRRGYHLDASPWANPIPIGSDERRRDEVIEAFRAWVLTSPDAQAAWIREHISELRGKRLACWCAPRACHGDVLAELADR